MIDDRTDGKISKSRLEALVDGIFAFAMTLLVTGLFLPHIPRTEAEAKLAGTIAEMRSEFISFLVAFFVLASFWQIHNRQFHHVRRVDAGLMRITLFILACVVLMPFTTNISGDLFPCAVCRRPLPSQHVLPRVVFPRAVVVPDETPGYHICCDQQSRCFDRKVAIPDHTGCLGIGLHLLVYQSVVVDGHIHPDYTVHRRHKEILFVKHVCSFRIKNLVHPSGIRYKPQSKSFERPNA